MWTDDEVKIMVDNPTLPTKKLKLLLKGKTTAAIDGKRARLRDSGYILEKSTTGKRYWTEEELTKLSSEYGRKDVASLAKELKRTVRAVKTKYMLLNGSCDERKITKTLRACETETGYHTSMFRRAMRSLGISPRRANNGEFRITTGQYNTLVQFLANEA